MSPRTWALVRFVAPLLLAGAAGWGSAQMRVTALEQRQSDQYGQIQQQLMDIKSDALRGIADLRTDIRDLRDVVKR